MKKWVAVVMLAIVMLSSSITVLVPVPLSH